MGGRDDIITLGPRDGRYLRRAGVFLFTVRRPTGRARALFVGEATDMSVAASPGSGTWCSAISLGLNELVAIPEDRPEVRRRLVDALIEELEPPLNAG